jgi:predicted CXXCH cytochrome family protein
MRAGSSRTDWLANYVGAIGDVLWDTNTGDGLHSSLNRQQGTDFLRSRLYRNSTQIVTCTDCHDSHGNSGLPHQLRKPVDSARGGAGLCLDCHDATFPPGPTVAARMLTHYSGHGIPAVAMDSGDLLCTDCHMPMTAKSAAGSLGAMIQGVQYYSGDTASHVFDVPRPADIKTKGPFMMPVAYTSACGPCHVAP